MGKHFWWGCGLLALLLAFTWTVGIQMERTHQMPQQLLTQAQEAPMGQATQMLAQAQKLWQRQEYWVSAVADHTPMEQIRALFAEAVIFGQAGEEVHFSTVCAHLASLLQDMSDAHQLTLQNLF